jgi:hypothetical protein
VKRYGSFALGFLIVGLVFIVAWVILRQFVVEVPVTSPPPMPPPIRGIKVYAL